MSQWKRNHLLDTSYGNCVTMGDPLAENIPPVEFKSEMIKKIIQSMTDGDEQDIIKDPVAKNI
jgi:hypothetical protein